MRKYYVTHSKWMICQSLLRAVFKRFFGADRIFQQAGRSFQQADLSFWQWWFLLAGHSCFWGWFFRSLAISLGRVFFLAEKSPVWWQLFFQNWSVFCTCFLVLFHFSISGKHWIRTRTVKGKQLQWIGRYKSKLCACPIYHRIGARFLRKVDCVIGVLMYAVELEYY